MDAHLDPLAAPTLAHPRLPPHPATSFRDHLADGLSVASDVARAAGAVIPGAGLVSLALSGLSHLVGHDAAPAGAGADATSAVLAGNQALDTRYLLLQARMQRESRMYTAISNILRVRHDAAKNAIANIR